jgi:type I restriction enzyme R subunit
MIHNEDSRVKIPAILHLVRLGYEYLSLKGQTWDKSTNIFRNIFDQSIQKINPHIEAEDISRFYDDISLLLENEDLGKAFYEKLIDRSGIRLIDFENLDNNSFHVVTELPFEKDEDNFRPDITLLINGMPLVFIEVKKPNNRDGVIAEHERMRRRFQNKKFRKFINITQLMVFSNNMEYDDSDPEPIQGAFYAAPSYTEPIFNYFKEEEHADLAQLLKPADDGIESYVLKDTNLTSIKHSPEFITNMKPEAPTNRISTSLFRRDRLAFILYYSIAYVNEAKGMEKHVMRYPQIFATSAIENTLNQGIKKGIIWHTQGSGKTALAFYNVRYLTDHFQKKDVVPKFYFIVDRIDLLIQASREFTARGLTVYKIDTREDFAKDIKSTTAIHNHSGKPEITVVNIQKFKDDPDVTRNEDYNVNIQRVYFLDEVHRSYNPKGSFLANLQESDQNAIKIGLTGTPLLGEDYNSRALFGNYIHKYYYNKSIADGYTLRLIREEIETSYKLKLAQILDEINVMKGEAERKQVYAHPRFVEPMLDYIIKDFEQSRMASGDNTIGGMVICDSSEQAKQMFEIFNAKYAEKEAEQRYFPEPVITKAAEPREGYRIKKAQERKVTTAALILHDIGTKQERKDKVEHFKEGKIDFLFVYNMLLTGFDAKRLKKLYLGRVIKSHNLLQALTRVNRRYKDFRYGYVVDFANIKSEFDKTNKAYFDELQSELGDEMEHYSNLFKSAVEIEQEIREIKDALFYFDTSNAEVFSQQISEIRDRKQMLEIAKALNNAKSLYNLIRLSGNYELLEKLDFNKLTLLSRMANDHLALINKKEAIEKGDETANLLNVALEEVLFAFTKVSEEELILADRLKDILRCTRETLAGNLDQKSKEFISLKEELERLFKRKNLNEVTKEEMAQNIEELNRIYDKAREDERKNQLLKAKYANDAKYARIHKRLIEKGDLTQSEAQLFEALSGLKEEADNQVLQNSRVMENESFVNQMLIKLVIEQFRKKSNIPLNAENSKYINNLLVKEYMNEYNGRMV